MSKRRSLSIIIPVFNEGKTVQRILTKVSNIRIKGWSKEIIIIDDGSSDDTKEKIIEVKTCLKRKPLLVDRPLKIVSHKNNLGKGAAIKTGLKHARGEAVIIQDADLEYDPREITRLLAKYSPNLVVFGSRNIKHARQGYRAYVWGDKFLTFLVNLFFWAKLTDVFTCYKLIPMKILKSIPIESRGFEFEMELTIKLLKMGVKIIEVPISYTPRTYKEGKKFTIKRAIKDGCLSLWYLIKFASCKTHNLCDIK